MTPDEAEIIVACPATDCQRRLGRNEERQIYTCLFGHQWAEEQIAGLVQKTKEARVMSHAYGE